MSKLQSPALFSGCYTLSEGGIYIIINPKWLLALRCPCCQERLLYRAISYFALHNGQTIAVHCSCGAQPLHLYLSDRRLYADCYCSYCEENHHYIFPRQGFKAEPPFVLNCENMDIRLASLGGPESALEAMNEESAMILDYAEELNDCFVQPTIIGRSLLSLNRLIVDRSCQCAACGQEDLDVLILADRLILSCPHCGISAHLKAANVVDLQLLNKITRISLLEDGLRIRYK